MSHNCNTCVIYCMDWRLGPGQADLDKLLLEQGIVESGFDRVVVGGAAKNLASPPEASDISFLLRQVEIADKLHKVSKVVLINHTDCGAYGGSSQFVRIEDEVRFHGQELIKAAKLIGERFPHLKVETHIALLKRLGNRWQVELV